MRKANMIPELKVYWERYTSRNFQSRLEPLEITVDLLSPLPGYDNLMLDSLLARLVVDRATNGNMLDDSKSPYLLPTPLKMLWTSQSGLPLWAANQFMPQSENSNITIWWHKKNIRPELGNIRKGEGRGNIQTVLGRYKEKRTPLPAQTAKTWSAACIGNIDEIAELLKNCWEIGKKRGGVVSSWAINKTTSFEFNRPVPIEYYAMKYNITEPIDMINKPWTSPYWVGVPETHGLCYIPKRK